MPSVGSGEDKQRHRGYIVPSHVRHNRVRIEEERSGGDKRGEEGREEKQGRQSRRREEVRWRDSRSGRDSQHQVCGPFRRSTARRVG